MPKETYTITFGDQAENHVGMQKIGQPIENGLTLDDLRRIKSQLKDEFDCKIYKIPDPDGDKENNGYILILRNGLNTILKEGSDAFFQEQEILDKDKHALMYGRVVNKKARYNLCFSDFDQEPDYESGKGTVVSFKKVPLLNKVRKFLHKILGFDNLQAEGNYYYDIDKCGIGFHGDTERKIVVGVRVGASMPLHFVWFNDSKPISDNYVIELHDGDIYLFNWKCVGYDWKKKNINTLRHATGERFTNAKK